MRYLIFKIKTHFYFLRTWKLTYKKELFKFVDEFHEDGLVKALMLKFNISEKKAVKKSDKYKIRYGYDIKSIAAEEDSRVKAQCFRSLYFKI